MNGQYEVILLEPDQADRLGLVYRELRKLSGSRVPSVRAAARASLAHIYQAHNGQGMAYDLYTKDLSD